jgi:hypothetical protein
MCVGVVKIVWRYSGYATLARSLPICQVGVCQFAKCPQNLKNTCKSLRILLLYVHETYRNPESLKKSKKQKFKDFIKLRKFTF